MSTIAVDWNAAIHSLRAPGQSDSALAAELGISKQLLSAVLNGKKELSPRLKAQIWARLDSDQELDANTALAFLPRQKALALLSAHALGTKGRNKSSRTGPSEPIGGISGAAADLERLKAARGLTDAQLAAELGVDESYIAHLRSGRQEVSLNLKTKILSRLGYDLTRDSVLWILGPSKAAAVIEADRERSRRRAQRALDARTAKAEKVKGKTCKK